MEMDWRKGQFQLLGKLPQKLISFHLAADFSSGEIFAFMQAAKNMRKIAVVIWFVVSILKCC